jgi:hypothetical protein
MQLDGTRRYLMSVSHRGDINRLSTSPGLWLGVLTFAAVHQCSRLAQKRHPMKPRAQARTPVTLTIASSDDTVEPQNPSCIGTSSPMARIASFTSAVLIMPYWIVLASRQPE